MPFKVCSRFLNHCRLCRVRFSLVSVAKITVSLGRLLLVHLVNLSSLLPLAAVAQEALDGDVAEVLDPIRDGRDRDA